MDVSSEYSGAREYSEPDIRLFDLVNVFKQSHAHSTLDPRHAKTRQLFLGAYFLRGKKYTEGDIYVFA